MPNPDDDPRARFPRSGKLLLSVGLCLALGACRSQILPGPMEPLADPLPPGDSELYPAGPEEIVIVRHADPVQVRPAGLSSAYPLSFYNKTTRLNSGSGVYSSPGGRVELIWRGQSELQSSVVLSGQTSGILGSVSRGEPTFIFRELERATLMLTEGDQIELLGGALFSGPSGPYVVEKRSREVMRARNQSKRPAVVAFRDQVFQLDPGQVIDLPLLTSGGAPVAQGIGFDEVQGPGFRARVRGTYDLSGSPRDLTVESRGESELRALGLTIRLDQGDSAVLGGLAPSQPPSTP